MAIVLSFISARLKTAREQKRAVLAIQGMGGYVEYNGKAPMAPGVLNRWTRQTLGDDFFEYVTRAEFQRAETKRWTQEEYRKYGANASADELSRWEPWTHDNVLTLKVHLENLTKLESLSFYQTAIPRHGLEIVSELRNLRDLQLDETQVTSIDLRYLSRLESLERLSLRRTRIRDLGLAHLKQLTHLKSLHLGSTAISDEGLRFISELTNLETLILGNTKITDAGIHHLSRLTNLKSLDLGLTDVSDLSIEPLASLVRLDTLIVGDKVTSEGLGVLKRSLPRCEIEWSAYRGRSH